MHLAPTSATMLRGVCLDPNNIYARPTIARLRHLGCTYVRLVAKRDAATGAYASALNAAGIAVGFVLTSDSFSSDDYAAEMMLYLRRYPYAVHWLIGNEWNMRIPGDASWPTSDDATIQLGIAVVPLIKAIGGIALLGGMFSEDNLADHAIRIAVAIDTATIPYPLDGVDIHPYLPMTPDFPATVATLRNAGLMVTVTEWNDSRTRSLRAWVETMASLGIAASGFIPWDRRSLGDALPGLTLGTNLTTVGRALRAAYKAVA